MAKELLNKVKLQIPAGKATAAPPVGTALGPFGIALPDFCTRFNDATKDKMGDIVPVEVYIYEDRSFDFITKVSPVANLIKKAANIKSGSKVPNKDKVAKLTKDQVKQIAETKMKDLNANSIEAAMSMIAGTARSMGITVEE